MRSVTTIVLGVILCFILAVPSDSVSAQNNLLFNPGFEQPYGGGYHRNTAQGWSSWVGVGDADFYPEQFGAVYSGGNSQAAQALGVIRDSSPLDVALYQTAHNVPNGSRVRASAWVSVWMTGVPDPVNAGAWLRIGVDPNGGTNPNDGDVVWSGVNASQGGSEGGQGWLLSYTPIAVEATTTGSSVTVFLRWQQTWGGNEQRAFFDEASLVVLQAGSGSVPDVSVNQPVEQPTVVPNGTSGTYVVRSGDTLYRIARRFDTSIAAIVKVNNLANPNLIHTGLTLIIPGTDTASVPTPSTNPPPQQPSSSTTCSSPYIVQRGDTLYRIALRCGTTVDAIAAANALDNRNLIFVNQQLVIP